MEKPIYYGQCYRSPNRGKAGNKVGRHNTKKDMEYSENKPN